LNAVPPASSNRMTANGPLAATKGSPLARIHWIIGKSEM
jgi:hypothetical protein